MPSNTWHGVSNQFRINSKIAMNKNSSTSLVVAAAVSGVALIVASSLVSFAGFELAEAFGFVAASALVAFAINDYARRPQTLRLPLHAPRTLTPARSAVAAGPRGRATAYGLPHAARRPERLAA